jgi:hypothetical protein
MEMTIGSNNIQIQVTKSLKKGIQKLVSRFNKILVMVLDWNIFKDVRKGDLFGDVPQK